MRVLLGFLVLVMIAMPVMAERKIERHVLDNGLTVILEEDHSAPLAAFQAFVKAGSITEGKYLGSGISHYFEHMLFKGTKKLGVGEYAKKLREAGSNDINAYTSLERTVYHFTIRSEFFDIGLECLSDALMNASLPEDEAAKEKEVILKEINMKDDNPSSQFWQKTMESLFKVHPYKYSVIGYRNLFSEIKREEILDYFNTMYAPNNMIFVVVGDFNSAQALEKIKTAFADFERRRLPDICIPEEPEQIMPRYTEFDADVKIAKLRIAYPAIPLRNSDVYALDVLSLILGNGESSLLSKKLKDDLKQVYSTYSFNWTPKYKGAFMIDANLDEANIPRVRREIEALVEHMKTVPVTDEQLEKAINRVISGKYFGNQTVSDKAGNLGDNEMDADDCFFSDAYITGIKGVTKEDIMRVAKKYLCAEKQNVIVMLPKKPKMFEKSPTIKSILQAATQKNDMKSFLDTVEKYTLHNGATVLLNKNSRLPIVHVDVVFNGGLRIENKDNNGVTGLMTSILKKGTKNRTAAEISEQLESVGASISTYSGNFSFGFEMDVLTKELPLGMDILADMIKNPLFPADELETLKKNLIAAIKSKDDNMWAVASKIYRETVYAGHPYSMDRDGSVESVEKVTVDSLKQHYHKYLVPNNMVISVCGDFDENVMKAEIERYFGSLQPAEFTVPKIPQQPSFNSIVEKSLHLEGKKQSIFYMTFPGPHMDDDDRIAASLMTTAISGIGNRLFRNLRGKKGLAYSVGAFSGSMMNAGTIGFFIGTVPEKVQEARDSMIVEIKDILTNSITDEELNRAKGELIGGYINNSQTNSDQSKNAALNELYGFGYAFSKDYISKVKAVTREDIKKLANKYINLNKYVFTIVEP